MALSFAKKKSPASNDAETSAPSSSPKKSGLTFMKSGAAAKEAVKAEEARRELAKAEAGKLWRFWCPPEAERNITFLDGNLDDDGMLDILMFREHSVNLNGERKTFVCTAEADQTQPCPICEKGDTASLVGVMTIIDHTSHTIKKGPNAGKTISNTRKLFVAKLNTLKYLQKLAVKRGGLAGCTFDVSRTSDKDAAVGDKFDFVSKSTIKEIMAKYDLKAEDVAPADYEAEVRYHTPEELIELGVGKAATGVGYSAKGKSVADEL